MATTDLESRLASWFAQQLPEGHDVHIEGLARSDMGHSAETLLLTLAWRADVSEHHQDVAIRVRAPRPGLLEPYDLGRQFEILRALEPTPVRAPRALWFEPSGEVLGREFYVMERLGGKVYDERSLPEELTTDPARVRRTCEAMVEQIAAIHTVDLHATGLHAIADGRAYLDRELDHWSNEIRRVQRGPLPALECLATVLREHQPEQYPTVTLVHGDPKPGNFAFEGAEVSGVFDWEMTTVGDPLADLGWAELTWTMDHSIVTLPGAPRVDELIARYEELTGIKARRREWYRAFQGFKMAVILLVAGHLFDAGDSDDWRFLQMAYAVRPSTQQALRELGVDEDLESGPVLPRKERVAEVKSRRPG
jgi:aminoglycoside phosphotransferase (APT) family kinase protein